MNEKDFNFLKENYSKSNWSLANIFEMIEHEIVNHKADPLVLEQQGGRFSFSIDFPTFTPSEAWGDPDSADREQIQKIFSVVRGGADMKANIADINKFLDPKGARRKRSPRVIINMMMIIEALQATLNDYNESAAGFVFEGFMSALTGGHQVAGKVEGTLPIEDFVAFSSYGKNQPVSLKLLSGKTPIKGSFTNIVDFLLVRGAESIKYLVAYKLTSGADVVQKLNIYGFDITRENFIEFMEGVSGGVNLLSHPGGQWPLKTAMKEFNANPSQENLAALARVVVDLGGYSNRGLLHKIAAGEQITKPTPEDEMAATAAAEERREEEYWRTRKFSHPEEYEAWNAERLAKRKADRAAAKAAAMSDRLNEAVDKGQLTINEAFHYIEKFTMTEERILFEGRGDDKSQWAASLSQLEDAASLINLESYGELDLSQSNIDELAEIYSEKLKGSVMTLLTEAKNLSENIGEYYTAKRRAKANAAAQTAIQNSENISAALEEDPRYS